MGGNTKTRIGKKGKQAWSKIKIKKKKRKDKKRKEKKRQEKKRKEKKRNIERRKAEKVKSFLRRGIRAEKTIKQNCKNDKNR